MDDDHDHRTFNLELTGGKFSPSSSPGYHITFNFKFELKISEFVVDHGSEILTLETDETVDDSTRVSLIIHPHKTIKEIVQLFVNETSESITSILACLPIRVFDDERRTIIDFAVGEAQYAIRNGMHDCYEAVELYILVRIEEGQVFHLWDVCMVPAADWSVEVLLNKYEYHIGEKIDDESCCICYEELVSSEDVALTSMPCTHVFHGVCIKKWLSYSHYCPICRFQMPTHIT